MLRNVGLTGVSGLAGAVIIVNEIYTGGAVLALSNAVVYVLITIFAGPAGLTFAPVVAYQVHA